MTVQKTIHINKVFSRVYECKSVHIGEMRTQDHGQSDKHPLFTLQEQNKLTKSDSLIATHDLQIFSTHTELLYR